MVDYDLIRRMLERLQEAYPDKVDGFIEWNPMKTKPSGISPTCWNMV